MDVVKKGVYALFREDELVYIGQSTNFYSRIGSHIESDKNFDSFELFEMSGCSQNDLDVVERNLIERYAPEYNVVHKNILFAKKNMRKDKNM